MLIKLFCYLFCLLLLSISVLISKKKKSNQSRQAALNAACTEGAGAGPWLQIWTEVAGFFRVEGHHIKG